MRNDVFRGRYPDVVLKGLVSKRTATPPTIDPAEPARPAAKRTTAAQVRAERDAAQAGAANGAVTKGKATPTRREAEAARRTSVIGGGGTGAARGSGSGKRGRPTREEATSRREAMRRGDDRVLSARDRGPVRAFVRDYVDSRRNVIGLFIYVGVPAVALAYSHVSLLTLLGLGLLYVFVVAAAIDFFFLVRGLGKAVEVKFPDQPRKNLGRYAMMRAMQLRRSRVPQPRVERGSKLS
jgi:hypothetical protein